MEPLLVHPKPLESESLAGYLLRLTQGNYYTSPRLITSLMKAGDYVSSAPGIPFLERLSALTQQPVDFLLRTTAHVFASALNMTAEGQKGTLDEVAIQRFTLESKRLRICPGCVSTSKPMQVMWQTRLATVCLEHNSLLIERCPACNAKLTINTVWRQKCQCGALLSDMPVVLLGKGADGLKLQSLIQHNLLHKDQTNGLSAPVWFASLDFLRKWLASFPPGTLSLDGLFAIHTPESKQKMKMPVDIDHVHYGLATQVLSEGFPAFAQLCRLWLDSVGPDTRFVYGTSRDLMRIKKLLNDWPRPEFAHLHNWYGEFVANEWSGGYNHPIATRGAEPRERRVGLNEAARILGCRSWNVLQLLRSGRLTGRILSVGSAGQVYASIGVDEVHHTLQRRQEAIPLEDAARRIGIPCPVMTELYQSGTVPGERGPLSDGTSFITVHPSTISDFVDRLRTASGAPNAELVPLDFQRPKEAAILLKRILQGLIPAYVVFEGFCLVTILTVAFDSATLVDTHGGESSTTRSYTWSEAAHYINVSEPLLRKLVSSGLVETDKNGLPTGIESFFDKFIWHFDAALRLGITTRKLQEWVEWRRVTPVFRADRGMLFLTADIARFSPENCCTVREAASILGVRDPQRIRHLIRLGKLTPIAGPGMDEGNKALLARGEVEAIRNGQLPAIVSLSEAAQYLGMDRVLLLDRIHDGSIPAVSGPNVDGKRVYRIRRDVVENLVTNEGGRYAVRESQRHGLAPIMEQTPPDPEGLVSTAEAAAMLRISPDRFYHRYRLTGVVSPCHRRARADYYRRSDIEHLRDQVEELQRLQTQDPDMITGADAATILGVSQTHFYRALVFTGKITAALERRDGFGSRFRRKDVMCLRAKYDQTMDFSETRLALGVTPRTLRHWVTKGAISPAPGFDQGDVTCHRFGRDDVANLKAAKAEMDNPELIGAQQAARILGMSYTHFVSLLDKGCLTPRAVRPNGWQLFSLTEIRAIRDFLDQTVTGGEAAEVLGVDSTTIYRWKSKGVLQVADSPIDAGTGRYRFWRRDIERLQRDRKDT